MGDLFDQMDAGDGISSKWAKAALAFHEQHPFIYRLLTKYAREAKAAGMDRIGIELLWNRVRWDAAVETKDTEFKVNQNFKAWYAREIMRREPDLDGVFETRRRDRRTA